MSIPAGMQTVRGVSGRQRLTTSVVAKCLYGRAQVRHFHKGCRDQRMQHQLLLCDDAQSIYDRTRTKNFSLKSVGIQAAGRTTILKINYRNTRQILQLAHRMAGDMLLQPEDATGGDDGIPLLHPLSCGREGPEPIVIDDLASAAQAQDWRAALDAYEGANALPLMTLHKSKGLEYHTVIFVGLDDDAWWSYIQDPVDATAGFFVAFTRAKQRVIFTYSPERGQRTKVAPLYELLDKAGVPRIAVA